jgi:hypothetical protein
MSAVLDSMNNKEESIYQASCVLFVYFLGRIIVSTMSRDASWNEGYGG